MATITLTLSAVDAAESLDKAIELRETVLLGFLCKATRLLVRCSGATVLRTKARE